MDQHQFLGLFPKVKKLFALDVDSVGKSVTNTQRRVNCILKQNNKRCNEEIMEIKELI